MAARKWKRADNVTVAILDEGINIRKRLHLWRLLPAAPFCVREIDAGSASILKDGGRGTSALTLSSPSWAASGNLSAGTCNFACWHCSDKIHCGLNGSFPVELSLGSQIVPCGEALRHPQVPPAGLHRKNPQCFPGPWSCAPSEPCLPSGCVAPARTEDCGNGGDERGC
ncbi:Hypothetical predicted protein, partial [Podarcis lilfordi]